MAYVPLGAESRFVLSTYLARRRGKDVEHEEETLVGQARGQGGARASIKWSDDERESARKSGTITRK